MLVFFQERYEKELKDTRARELMYAEEAAILDKVSQACFFWFPYARLYVSSVMSQFARCKIGNIIGNFMKTTIYGKSFSLLRWDGTNVINPGISMYISSVPPNKYRVDVHVDVEGVVV